jgi:hypothetical protein
MVHRRKGLSVERSPEGYREGHPLFLSCASVRAGHPRLHPPFHYHSLLLPPPRLPARERGTKRGGTVRTRRDSAWRALAASTRWLSAAPRELVHSCHPLSRILLHTTLLRCWVSGVLRVWGGGWRPWGRGPWRGIRGRYSLGFLPNAALKVFLEGVCRCEVESGTREEAGLEGNCAGGRRGAELRGALSALTCRALSFALFALFTRFLCIVI